MNKTLKINISGPESAGKTTLARELCTHYDGDLVEDFSRTYFECKEISNDYQDIMAIAKKQIELEKEALANPHQHFIFCDTDLINIKIWLAYYNYEIPAFIQSHIHSFKCDLTLLLYPNTEWEEDPLRQNKKDRLELFEQFEKELTHYNYPFRIIKKLGTERLHQAISEIDLYIKT